VIILHDLTTGAERQLTYQQENIDDLKWTDGDRIIFSSNRSGNTNLWVISASGGEAAQLTKGAGPDIGLNIAASGNELVYLQQQRVGQIWTANLDGSSLRQVTFDDRDMWEPSFSPDKRRIVFVMNDPDPLANKADVYVMDRDGNNRRQLTNGLPNARFPLFSPDDRWVSFSQPATGHGQDTVNRVLIVDPDNPGPPKRVGEHFQLLWIDDDHILSTEASKSYLISLSKNETRRFFTDSTVVWNNFEGQKLVYFDRRFGSEGWWVVSIAPTSISTLMSQTAGVIMPELRGSPRLILRGANFLQAFTARPSSNGDILQVSSPGKVRVLSSRLGTVRELAATFPGLRNRGLDLSDDGKEVVFVTPRLSSRLVLLENIFK